MRKFKEEYIKKHHNEHEENIPDDYMKAEAETLQVGDRCKIVENGYLGTIEYIGEVSQINKGYYLGIRLDQAVGKNDGR